MGILGNYSVLHKSPGRFLSGTVASGDRYNFSKSGMLRNRFAGDQGLGIAKFSAIPNGYVHPYSWALAQQSGGLASYKQLSAAMEKTDALLALGINIDAAISANMTITNAPLALIVALEAALSAGITLTQAQLAIIILLEADLSANGSFTDAQLGNILGLTASLSASMTLTNSITNLVNLSADIGGAEALSPQGLANAVWNAQTSSYQTAGSTGKALTDAGGAGNPWAALVDDNDDPGTFGERMKKLLKLAQFLGLK